MMQQACFHYYWEGADPHSGMTRENIPGDERIVATGASGMGIMSLIVGVDRKFITRAEGVERLTKIVDFLEHAQRYHGVWSHYMNGATGKPCPSSACTTTAGTSSKLRSLCRAFSLRASISTDRPAEQISIAASPACGGRRVGLASRLNRQRFPLLALVSAVGFSDSSSAYRL